MRIGIDIDGVLTDLDKFQFDYFSKFCVENGVNYKIGESFYNISQTFGVDKTHEDAFWEKYLEFYSKNEKARRFSSEVIKKLKEEGHEIFIITARWSANRNDSVGEKMRSTVKNWLNENEIIYDKLIFSQASHERKSVEITENKIDLMIEDSPRNIAELSKIVPILCFDASYNKTCNYENVERCFSWFDIYKKVHEIVSE